MKFQLKRSNQLTQGGTALTPDGQYLEFGEIAINYNATDPAIFFKDTQNNVIRISGVGAQIGSGNITLTAGSGISISNPNSFNLQDSYDTNITISVNQGTGSGFDADLLDGQHGSYYQNASNLNSGTISNDRLPSTITSDITGNADTVDNLHAASFLRSDANDSFSGNLTNAGDNYITFGPNSTWQNYLRIGGNGYKGGTDIANIASTNGNLHLDPAPGKDFIINYYAGNGITKFCNGANSIVAVMGSDGDLWKGSGDNTGSKYWHAGNDGSGSGLDADKLDGVQGSSFLRSDANDTYSGLITGNQLHLGGSQIMNSSASLQVNGFSRQGTIYLHDLTNGVDSPLKNVNGELIWNTDVIWHAGNDGSGSGLDADTLDGFEGSYYQNASNLNAGTIPDARISDIGNSQARLITFDNVEKSDLTADGQLGFDSSQGLLVFRAQQGTSGAATTILDGWNVEAGSNISITNLGAGSTSTGQFTFSVNRTNLDADLLDGQHGSYYQNASNLNTGTISDARIPDTITPVTLVQTKEIRTSNGTEVVINAGESSGKFSGQTGEKVYLNAEGGIRITTPTVANYGSGYQATYTEITGKGIYFRYYDPEDSAVERVGEITSQDDSWLRINQETNKNIYTPRYIRADAGFFVDSTSKGINGSGNFIGGTIAGASDYGTLLRSNASDQYDGQTSGRVMRFRCVDGRNAGSSSGSLFPLEVYQSSNGTNSDAAMAFHIAGRFATYFGLDRQTNDLFTGGWSDGSTKHKIWHAGNDGSGSGLDADTVDGIQGGSFLRSDANDTATGTITFNGRVNIRGHLDFADEEYAYFGSSDDTSIRHNSNGWTYVDFKQNGMVFRDNGSDRIILEDSGVFRPNSDNARTIGTSSHRWADIYAVDFRGNFIGTGGSITGINANNISSGTINDARLPDTIGRTTFNAGVKITGTFNDTQTTHLVLQGGDPTITFSDNSSGADDFYIHVNSNNFYILTDRGGGAGAWETPHPMQIEADTNDVYFFGRRIIDNGNFSVNSTGYFSGNVTAAADLSVGNSITMANALIHAGDTNTYFQFHGNDICRIVCAGAEVQEWGNNYTLLSDNDTMRFGSGSDYRIWHDGTNTYMRNYNHGAGSVYHQGENTSGGNKNCIIEVYNVARPYVSIHENGGERIRTTSGGATIYGTLIVNNDLGVGATPGGNLNGRAHCIAIGDSDTGIAQNGDGQLELWANNQEIINCNTTEIVAYKDIQCGGSGLPGYNNRNGGIRLERGTGSGFFYRDTGFALHLGRDNNGEVIRFKKNNSTQAGTIRIASNSTISVNNGSDYRIKKNIEPIEDPVGTLKKLKPCQFEYISEPGEIFEGFVAHELQEVNPHYASGEKDEVDEEGEIVIQGVDTRDLVAVLTASLQKAFERIEILEERLNQCSACDS